MKKLVLTGAAMALALGAFAQGSINVGNTVLNPYISVGDANTHYNGAYTLQVWELNGSTIPAGLTGQNGSVDNNGVKVGAYGVLTAAGSAWTLEKTYTGTMTDGMFALGQLNMANVSPAGSSVTLALAVWNAGAGSGFLDSDITRRSGMSIFVNPTADYTIAPPNTPTPPFLTGWDALGQNLVMTPVPEPSTFALAGLGAAALLIFRRRK